MDVRFAPGAVLFFKRLKYTPWHAVAEFVDNSTQSFLDHREVLTAHSPTAARLTVVIEYDGSGGGRLTIHDNAMGMSEEELARALTIGQPPPNRANRSQYGLGLKTAATWFGDRWTVRTKRLGSPKGFEFIFDVDEVAAGQPIDVEPYAADVAEHYTQVEISRLNRRLYSKTQESVGKRLQTMYQKDIQEGWLDLIWMGRVLGVEDAPRFAEGDDGSPLARSFQFVVGGRPVNGWAGVLHEGSRSKAGFAVLHAKRVIRTAPDAWKPAAIFGEGGRNDLINQRLVGEVELDAFPVSHTKDDIVWTGEQEQEVELALRDQIADLISAARALRKKITTGPPPPTDIRRAALALQVSVSSSALATEWLSPEDATDTMRTALVASVMDRAPDFTAAVDGFSITGFVDLALTALDPYLVFDRRGKRLSVVINLQHPYASSLRGEALIVHAEHCAFDALAHWRVQSNSGTSDHTEDVFKDSLLRIAASRRK